MNLSACMTGLRQVPPAGGPDRRGLDEPVRLYDRFAQGAAGRGPPPSLRLRSPSRTSLGGQGTIWMPETPSNSTVLPFVIPTDWLQPPGTSSTNWLGAPTERAASERG